MICFIKISEVEHFLFIAAGLAIRCKQILKKMLFKILFQRMFFIFKECVKIKLLCFYLKRECGKENEFAADSEAHRFV